MEKLIKLGGGWSLNPIETEGLTADEIQDLLSLEEDPFILREITIDDWVNSFSRLTCKHIEVNNFSVPLLGTYITAVCQQPGPEALSPGCVYYPENTEASLPIFCGHKSIIECPLYIADTDTGIGLCNSLSLPVCVYFNQEDGYSMGLSNCGHKSIIDCGLQGLQEHSYTLPWCKHSGMSIVAACLDDYSNCVNPPYVYPVTEAGLEILASKYPGFLKLKFSISEAYSLNVFVGDVFTILFKLGDFINKDTHFEPGDYELEWDTLDYCQKLKRKPAFVGIYGRNNNSSILAIQRFVIDNRKVVTGTAAFMTEMTIDLSSGII